MLLSGVLLAGCSGGGELPPCDAPERRAQAHAVRPMPAAVRDSIVGAFTGRPRIQQVTLEQQDCHFRAFVRVDSFATHRYAGVQGMALIRALKEKAPNETRPLRQEPAGQVGVGLYDYAIVIGREGRHEEEMKTPGPGRKKYWVRLRKAYHDRRVIMTR